MHKKYARRSIKMPANMHKKVEKCQHPPISIDEVKCRNKLATICLQKLDEVKCRNKYLEMNIPTRFQEEQYG